VRENYCWLVADKPSEEDEGQDSPYIVSKPRGSGKNKQRFLSPDTRTAGHVEVSCGGAQLLVVELPQRRTRGRRASWPPLASACRGGAGYGPRRGEPPAFPTTACNWALTAEIEMVDAETVAAGGDGVVTPGSSGEGSIGFTFGRGSNTGDFGGGDAIEKLHHSIACVHRRAPPTWSSCRSRRCSGKESSLLLRRHVGSVDGELHASILRASCPLPSSAPRGRRSARRRGSTSGSSPRPAVGEGRANRPPPPS
jgi:hypothetical protein